MVVTRFFEPLKKSTGCTPAWVEAGGAGSAAALPEKWEEQRAWQGGQHGVAPSAPRGLWVSTGTAWIAVASLSLRFGPLEGEVREEGRGVALWVAKVGCSDFLRRDLAAWCLCRLFFLIPEDQCAVDMR